MKIKNPLICGVGGVGSLLAVLLHEQGMKVTALDKNKNAAAPKGVKVIAGDVEDAAALTRILKNHDAVISCLPFHLTLNVAKAAHKAGIIYFDATEDVKTTAAVQKLARTAKKVVIP